MYVRTYTNNVRVDKYKSNRFDPILWYLLFNLCWSQCISLDPQGPHAINMKSSKDPSNLPFHPMGSPRSPTLSLGPPLDTPSTPLDPM